MKKLISVIIPTHKRQRCLLKCLNSLVNQERPPDQIVIVFQGDEEINPEIYNLIKKCKHFIKFTTARIGQSNIVAAENKGLEYSIGEIICLIDDDAIAPKNWVNKTIKHYKNETVGSVGGVYFNYHPKKGFVRNRNPDKIGKIGWGGAIVGNFYDLSPQFENKLLVDHLAGGNMSFRKKLINSIDANLIYYWQGFEIDICHQIQNKGYKIIFDPTLTVNHFPKFSKEKRETSVFLTGGSHNTTYLLLKYSHSFIQGIIRISYLFLLERGKTPGIFIFLIKLLVIPSKNKTINGFLAGIRGKTQGIKTYLKCK